MQADRALTAAAAGGGTIDAAATEALRARPRGPVRMFHRDGYFGPPVEPGR